MTLLGEKSLLFNGCLHGPGCYSNDKISAQIALRIIAGGYGLIAEHEAQETRQDRGNRPGSVPPVNITIINKSVPASKYDWPATYVLGWLTQKYQTQYPEDND